MRVWGRCRGAATVRSRSSGGWCGHRDSSLGGVAGRCPDLGWSPVRPRDFGAGHRRWRKPLTCCGDGWSAVGKVARERFGSPASAVPVGRGTKYGSGVPGSGMTWITLNSERNRSCSQGCVRSSHMSMFAISANTDSCGLVAFFGLLEDPQRHAVVHPPTLTRGGGCGAFFTGGWTCRTGGSEVCQQHERTEDDYNSDGTLSTITPVAQPAFALLYWASGSNPCHNRWERAAGWRDGGYRC
jgi:hypothetical protein